MSNFKMKKVLKSRRLAFLVAAAAVAAFMGTAKVYASPAVDRYGGSSRYETAAKLCDAGWSTNTDYAVLVNGENYPDALSAAPLAKKYNAPILLTGYNNLNPYTSSELTRLNVKNVFVIGGKAVVSQSIEDSLKARGMKVTRIGGSDRYDTALKIAAKIGKSSEVAVINGNDFRAGMTIASIAALKGMPVILTEGDYMPEGVKKYLGKSSKFDQIYVIGDENTISSSILEGISNVRRIGSGNAYARNVSVIEAFKNEVNTGTLYVASARDFPDSLGASALAPQTSSPVLFVDSPLDQATADFLKTHIINDLRIMGGELSVSDDLEKAVISLPLQVGNTDNMTDTIWQNEKYTPSATMMITATDGTKKEMAVDWNLTQVNTTKPGIYTFKGTVKGTDKIVYTTLTVKPLPYKIDDLEDTAVSREKFDLPTTISAQMTDGTTSQVPVSWDYGTQSGNKPGVYVFYGTVDKYSKKVKLTLTVADSGETVKTIKSIDNIKVTVSDKSSYTLPSEVPATMSDGSVQSVRVTWGDENQYAKGVYTYSGTVDGYSKKVNLMLIVTGEGGQDPKDPNYPDNPGDNDASDLGELQAIIQGEAYPSTVVDPKTKKPVKVTWTKAINIDATYVDKENVDDCRISEVTLEGTIGNNTKVKATIGIIPRILGITTKNNTSNTLIPVVIPIRNTGIYNMSEATDELRAVIIDPVTGNRVQKKVTVLLWNPPYVSVGNSQNYNVTATINNYINSKGTNTLDVTLQVQH
ncbi:cell wall-binding repeat-containing protein [Clostridium sp. JNZ X4-2]